MTRLVIDTHSAPAWEPGAALEVRLIAPDVEHTVTGTLVANPPDPTGDARSPDDVGPDLRSALGRAIRLANAAAIPDTKEWQARMRAQADDLIVAARAEGIDMSLAATPTAGAGGLADVLVAVDQVRSFLLLHREATGRSDVNIRKVVALLDDILDSDAALHSAALAPVAHRAAEPGEAT